MYPLGVLVISLLLTLPFRSLSLDDFDSYSFALALDDYDLALQQPQPPGFPVYIALARILRLICPEPSDRPDTAQRRERRRCTRCWSALLGRLIAPRLPTVACLGALLFALTPVSWLTGDKALSDMTGCRLHPLEFLSMAGPGGDASAGKHPPVPLLAA